MIAWWIEERKKYVVAASNTFVPVNLFPMNLYSVAGFHSFNWAKVCGLQLYHCISRNADSLVVVRSASLFLKKNKRVNLPETPPVRDITVQESCIQYTAEVLVPLSVRVSGEELRAARSHCDWQILACSDGRLSPCIRMAYLYRVSVS